MANPRPPGQDEPTAAAESTRELAALRRSIARKLRHKRTTEVKADNSLQLLFVPLIAMPCSLARARMSPLRCPG
jgi:uncharacterized protein (DUF58 family)